MNASEVSTSVVTPAPLGAADVAPDGTPNPPSADRPSGSSINGEQLLTEGDQPEVEKAPLSEDHIPINQVFHSIKAPSPIKEYFSRMNT